MEFKTIKKNNKNKIIIGGLIGIGLASALIYLPSRAKYRTTENFNIVNGTINYKVPDFKMIAMYSSEDGNNYTEIEKTPEKNYKINEEKSYCTLNNTDKDTEAKLYTDKYGQHIFDNITKNEKCYIWFDKNTEIVSTALGNLEVNNYIPDFSQPATTDEGIFKAEDNDGISYYWRGATEDNYLKFAGYCWRIIRINGDGTIRLIYDGEICHRNGKVTADNNMPVDKNHSFNFSASKNEYVGYTFTIGSHRGNETSSNIKLLIEEWYESNLKEYESKIIDGKYCNDRNVENGTIWQSTTSETFYYSAYQRVIMKSPILSCSAEDVYTLKVGLITADEVLYAGGGVSNISYYLYNGYTYWTMTPSWWNGNSAHIFMVSTVVDGGSVTNLAWNGASIRPVINLRADTVFSSGDGTIDTPFTVQ